MPETLQFNLAEKPFPLLFLIPLLPLVGASINGILGAQLQRRFGKWVINAVALTPVWLSFVLSFYAFLTVVRTPDIVLTDTLWKWIDFRWHGVHIDIDFSFALDRLSSVMILVVTGVGSLIHLFSTGYMQDEKPYWRFFAEMNLFMFAMLLLVMGDSFLMMFVGWEGVGLCSYLLISYYYEDKEKAAAGMKAFVVNRIGDFAFIIGMALLLWGLMGSWQEGGYHIKVGEQPTLVFRKIEALLMSPDFREAFLAREVWGIPVVTLSTILLFIGACGKSAQIPLYIWLPDAMAGPTPVSALIHAATMVTAGVYMVARLNFLFIHSPLSMTIVTSTGAVTALFAATMAFFQTDIKKVLAYSTVSQLGFMFIGVGVGAFSSGIFHLTTHAFFKACLFLCAGSIIYALHHKQELKNMGGLRRYMPATFLTFIVSTAAITGIPPLSGFFSKDEILWRAFDSGNLLIPGEIVWGLGAIAALFTAFYMTRLLLLTFYGENRADHHTREHIREYKRMTIPLYILAFFAAIGGFIGIPAALGGANHFEYYLDPVFRGAKSLIKAKSASSHTFFHSHTGEYILMASAVVIALAGIFAAFRIYYNRYLSPEEEAKRFGSGFHRLLFNKYFVDEIYSAFLVRPFLKFSEVVRLFDKWVIDGIVNAFGFLTRVIAFINGAIDKYFVDGLVNLLAEITISAGRRVRRIQSGKVQSYLLALTVSICGLVVLFYILKDVWGLK